MQSGRQGSGDGVGDDRGRGVDVAYSGRMEVEDVKMEAVKTYGR